MVNKAALYGFVENATPPFIFKLFKGSHLYLWLVRNAGHYSSIRTPQEVVVTAGDLAGYKLKLDPTGPWQEEMINGAYDHELFSYLHTLPLEGAVIYDIGAHICYHSLAFAKLAGPNGHVYAFEPNPANFARAEEIIALNDGHPNKITVLNMALSDHSGTTEFLSTADVEGGTSTGGFINEASTLWERDRYINKVGFTTSTVPLETMDQLVRDKKILPPTLIKLDVEGAEQLVLAGAIPTLRQYQPTIIVEFHSIYSSYSSMSILQNLGYTYELLKREPDGRVMIVATVKK